MTLILRVLEQVYYLEHSYLLKRNGRRSWYFTGKYPSIPFQIFEDYGSFLLDPINSSIYRRFRTGNKLDYLKFVDYMNDSQEAFNCFVDKLPQQESLFKPSQK